MKWYKVEDIMPENARCVLLYSEIGGVAEGAWIESKKRFEQWRWNAVVNDVTHWAYMPSPPITEKRNTMKKKELKDRAALLELELKMLRDQMKIIIESPDSPEASVVVTQWRFAKEIENAYNTGTDPDIPKLMGLFGRMMEPPKREPLWPVPANVSELKGLLSDFYCWIENRYGPLVHNADIRYYVNEFLSVRAHDEGK